MGRIGRGGLRSSLVLTAAADLLGFGEAFAMLLVSFHERVFLLFVCEVGLVGHSRQPDKALDLPRGIAFEIAARSIIARIVG